MVINTNKVFDQFKTMKAINDVNQTINSISAPYLHTYIYIHIHTYIHIHHTYIKTNIIDV